MSLDVLISGGGIAGPALAYWLVQQGHTVTIVERAATLRDGGQAVDFRGPSIEVLDKMGVLDAVRAEATRMESMVMVDAKGKEIARLPPGGHQRRIRDSVGGSRPDPAPRGA
ncbi:hypothetical protein CCUG60885_00626 [Mycobacteroides salmoniphilum]|uniref:FAD-binding domain-containing protein n=1 Tax=Mycobacteroides salmoniphilum TaxID=404941 RepID=A0A4R8SM59_9MYCO|nr:hypothetical protein CCUG60885_00626 [Mycobacteroides salmoniphilum]TEA08968.1 hypothetical protein CCUG60883_00406 [Mycobacteroides salmoniphilum]